MTTDSTDKTTDTTDKTTDRSNRFDFVGPRRIFAMLSAVLCICSAALFMFIGPTWGIDFTGGTLIELGYEKTADLFCAGLPISQ